MNVSRRAFIFFGVTGIAALAAARYWPRQSAIRADEFRTLDADGAAVIGAIVPVMLAGALPADSVLRARAIRDTVGNVDRAIAGLSPRQTGELGHLFAFFALPPVRWSLMHSTHAWNDAAPEEIDAMLARMRDSRIGLLRAAYDALHQLVYGAWYGDPRAWAAIGYGGPPQIG